MLALVKLEGYGSRRPHQLSGGQAQRVALARALAKRPKVLLLDEPMAALDKKLRAETQSELTNLQDKLGTTFIIVTHDQEEAMSVAHRIAVMNRGQIAQVATPAEIYEQPNSRYVADFIGDINLIEGTVTAVEPGATVVTGAGGERYRIAPNPEAWPGTRAWVALRPEKLRIAQAQPQETSVNCAGGTVSDIGYLGKSVIYKVRLDSGADMRASVPNPSRLIELPIGKDDRVWLTWAPESGMVLTH
jgi:putrescine transport system ATP-binding protein